MKTSPEVPTAAPTARPLRVLHFVSGGFSGATQVAIDLCGEQRGQQTLLVLRRRASVDPAARVAQLRALGLQVEVVPKWSHSVTIVKLARICRDWQPDVLVAHGFSEHLWGRYAGLLAKVPHLVHVEHNTRERYTAWRLAQTRWLAKRTDRIVGCSEGVRRVLLEMGMPPARTIAIPNGVRLQPFADAEAQPFAQRIPGIVMVARFSRQKDHATLLRAVAELRSQDRRVGLVCRARGSPHHHRQLEKLADELGIAAQVQFLGVVRDVPQCLMAHQLCVLSTHYEGMPLALLEGMAAGCAVVGSAVPGVREVLDDGVDGLLVAEADAPALADALERVLRDPPFGARLAAAARRAAAEKYSRERMNRRYEELFLSLARGA